MNDPTAMNAMIDSKSYKYLLLSSRIPFPPFSFDTSLLQEQQLTQLLHTAPSYLDSTPIHAYKMSDNNNNNNRGPQRRGGRGQSGRGRSNTSDEEHRNASRLQVDFNLPATTIGPVLRQRGTQIQQGGHQGPSNTLPTRHGGPYNIAGNQRTAPITQAGAQYAPAYRPPHHQAQNMSGNYRGAPAYRPPHHAAPTMSGNYRGSATRQANYSENIPDPENTSVWIQNLPPNTTYAMLLEKLVNTGKIFAVHINYPNEQHLTCAAKVQFWTVAGKDRLVSMVSREMIIFNDGYMPTVESNRIKTSAQITTNRSRVVTITGPRAIVNEANLTQFFNESISYQIEKINDTRSTTERGIMTWYFASYRLQAQSAHKKLTDRVIEARQLRQNGGDGQGWDQVQVGWARDPCDWSPTLIPATLASA
ncbi:hypothetical protein HD806DRAFT_550676 [Xylariaceae sp. AK1471]|nr:hypothetical protein HD806DRAFT_550676 [Xylariaceae sp. AK1471]